MSLDGPGSSSSQDKGWILTGWPENSLKDKELCAYLSRKSELSVVDGCLLWGNKVKVPEKGRKRVVAMLHQAHPGISGMVWLGAMIGGPG